MMPDHTDNPGVCILIAGFFPLVGGGETHARLLARELARLEVPVRVITARTSRDLRKEEDVDGFPVARVAAMGPPRLKKYTMLLPAFVQLIRTRKQYDVIYVCAFRVLGVLGVLAARLLGKKCVLRAESYGEYSGEFIWRSPGGKVSSLVKFLAWPGVALRNMVLKRCDRFLSISSGIQREFLDHGVAADQIVTIANGMDTERFVPVSDEKRSELKKELGLPGDCRLVSYSGKLDRGKGLEMLLAVWRDLCSKREDIHLALVGGGKQHSLSCEDDLRLFVKQNELDQRVTFTGYVHNVERYLQASEVYAFPSEEESFGLAPLEAMACGLAVVATRVGELPSVIEDGKTGFIVDVKDREGFAERLSVLLDDPEKSARMGAAAADNVRTGFGMGDIAKQHMVLFGRLCGRTEGDV